jgi:hypothetical protein
MKSKLLPRSTERVSSKLTDTVLILLITILGFLVMGYHPGLEDDGIYLSAVKSDLQPTLYPHDSDFFRLQLQATIFDRLIAGFIRVTHIPVSWAELLWQFLSLFFILWAAHRIACKLFSLERARWAGVVLLAAMLTLPVAGAAISLADQHLHPRNLATAVILLAVDCILARKTWHAIVLLILAFLIHPIMAAMGISFCLFLAFVLTESLYRRLHPADSPQSPAVMSAAAPLGWIFQPPSPTWRRALGTRTYYFLYQWTWYEWLGALGPLVLFWLLWRYATRRGETLLARFAIALLFFGLFQQAVAMILLAPAALVRVTPLQPMRYLHLVYMFLVLIAGCLIGEHLLNHSFWRWSVFLIAANGSMFASQRFMFIHTEHLEWPGLASHNSWLQAFAWIRQNTPPDAYFALDPHYLELPGEDYHCFRALAERSQLADAVKDAAVVTQVPELGPRWASEVDAQTGWSRFGPADFERLRTRFGVGWVLVSNPAPPRLTCVWHDEQLSICRIPDLAHTATF